jgi:hypothetical protein
MFCPLRHSLVLHHSTSFRLFTRFFLLLATIDRILPADGGQAVYVSPDGGGEIEIYAPFRLNSNGGNLTFF